MHVSLYVSNLERTVDFYQKFFQVPAHKVKTGYAKFVLNEPSLIISFIENAELVKAQFGHLGFQVQDDEKLQNALSAAKSAGLEVREEMGTHCCFAVQDKFWVNDPDGFAWEVYVFKEDAEFNDPHYSQSEASVCCMPPKASRGFKYKSPQGCEPNSGCC